MLNNIKKLRVSPILIVEPSGVARAECVISHGLLEPSNVKKLQYLIDFFE